MDERVIKKCIQHKRLKRVPIRILYCVEERTYIVICNMLCIKCLHMVHVIREYYDEELKKVI